jgi:long-chain acyl-CoA synthetase
MNLSTLPDLRAAQAPDAPAVADDSTDLTNTQFLHAVRRASAVLVTHGVSAGDVVAIMLPNQASYIVALFAALRLGATITPISPTSMPAEAAYQITDADAKVLIADTPLEIDVPGSGCVDRRTSFRDSQLRRRLHPPMKHSHNRARGDDETSG